MDTKAYLERINYTGALKPTFSVLRDLQKAHLLSVPFENLDIHYGQTIELDLVKIYKKVVGKNRGGFCYELNGLFNELLLSIGFQTKKIAARVYDKEKGYGQEYDHLALIVKIETEEYLADVGFGEFTFAPLKMELNILQKDPRGDYQLETWENDYLRVSKLEEDGLRPGYIFKTIARAWKDYAGMCHYHQTNPNSHFTQKRLITLPTPGGRITISGNKLKIEDGEQQEEKILSSEKEFKEALKVYFRVEI